MKVGFANKAKAKKKKSKKSGKKKAAAAAGGDDVMADAPALQPEGMEVAEEEVSADEEGPAAAAPVTAKDKHKKRMELKKALKVKVASLKSSR